MSDTHIPEAVDHLWPQVYEAFDGVDCIFHGGDIHEFWVLDTLEKIAPVYAARGNGEDGSGGRPVQPEDARVREAWSFEMENLTIGLTHYIPTEERPPYLTVARWVERYFPDKRPNVIVYGDTHTEAIEVVDGILCVNPGITDLPAQLRHPVRHDRFSRSRRRPGQRLRLAHHRCRNRALRLGGHSALAAALIPRSAAAGSVVRALSSARGAWRGAPHSILWRHGSAYARE